jgi:hypothetical protein
MSRLIVTDDATYEQRTAGTSNTGGVLTEVRRTTWLTVGDHSGWSPSPVWSLLDPSQAEPRVGDRWTLRYAHGKYVLTDVVNEVIGDLA